MLNKKQKKYINLFYIKCAYEGKIKIKKYFLLFNKEIIKKTSTNIGVLN